MEILERCAKFLSENLEKNLLWGHRHRCEDNIKIGLKDTSTGFMGCGLNSLSRSESWEWVLEVALMNLLFSDEAVNLLTS